MLATCTCLLALTPQLPQGSTVVEAEWVASELNLAQREAAAVLLEGDLIWTRNATLPGPSTTGQYVDLFRTQRTTLDGQVLWSDTEYGTTTSSLGWPEPLGRLPRTWPVDPISGALFLALPVDGVLVLKALDAGDGSSIWEQRIEHPPGEQEFTEVDEIYFDAARDQVVVLARQFSRVDVRAHDAGTGDLIWRETVALTPGLSLSAFEFKAETHGALVPGGDRLAVAAMRVEENLPRAVVTCFDLATGLVHWTNTQLYAEQIGLDLSPDAARLAVVTNGGPGPRIAQFDMATGQVQWQRVHPILKFARDPEVAYDPSGQNVLASAALYVDPSPSTPDTLGAQLTCVDSFSGQVRWSESRSALELAPEDASARGELAFLFGGEVHWSYPLPEAGAYALHRERLSLADGSTLQAVVVPSVASPAYPDHSLGLDGAGSWIVLGREPSVPISGDELAYVLRADLLDPVTLAGGASTTSELVGTDGSAVLSMAVSADGSRAAVLTGNGTGATQRLVALDAAAGTVEWIAELSEFPTLDLGVLALDASGQRIAVLRGNDFSVVGGPTRISVFDCASGSLLWEQDAGSGLAATQASNREGSRPLHLSEDALVLLSRSLETLDLAVLDPETGALRWTRNLYYGSRLSPVVDVLGDTVYAVSHEGSQLFGGPKIQVVSYASSDGTPTGSVLLPDFTNVSYLAAKPEGVFAGSTDAQAALAPADLSALVATFDEPQFGVYKLGPDEGFVRVGEGYLQQVGDVPQVGEDLALEFDWTLAGDYGSGGGFALFEERRQLYWQSELQASNGTASPVQGIDLERGRVMWTAEQPVANGPGWQRVTLGQGETSSLFTATTSQAPTAAEIPYIDRFARVELPALIVDDQGLSASEGGAADVYLRGSRPAPGALDLKLLLGSLSLATPGIPAGAFEVPFPMDDPLLACTLLDCDPEVLQGLHGSLGPTGLGYARIELPSDLGPEWAGQAVHWTWLQIDAATLGVLQVAPVVTVSLAD
jgi:outer membrane protein assembly factor BamB